MKEILIPPEILSTYFPSTGGLQTEHSDDKNNETLFAQIKHRIELVNFWSIPPGSNVLEIGCGQGDTTLVLAAQVGTEGHIDAVDPGDPDYGAPWTLSQAQSQLKSGPLGHRISFHNAFPISFLESLVSSSHKPEHENKPYTHIIFSHSTFYFSSPSPLPELIHYITSLTSSSSSVADKNTKICIAEWDLVSKNVNEIPHLLAVILQAVQEGWRRDGEEGGGNVRCVRSVDAMKKLMRKEGWVVEREERRSVGEGVEDGGWEVGNVRKWKEGELNRLKEERRINEKKESRGSMEEKRLNIMEMMYDVLDLSLENVEGGVKGVGAMGVWVVSFVRGGIEGDV